MRLWQLLFTIWALCVLIHACVEHEIAPREIGCEVEESYRDAFTGQIKTICH